MSYPAGYGPGCAPNTPFGEIVAAEEDVFIYVDSDSDDTCPGTKNHPVGTIDKAVALVPPTWRHQCQIILAPDDVYTLSRSNLNFGHPIGQFGSPLTFIGGYTEEADLTATVADPFGEFLTYAGPPIIGDFQGYWVTCTRGASVGMQVQIKRIVGNVISFVGAFFVGGISSGDQFVLQRDSVTIEQISGLETNDTILGSKGVRWFLPGANNFRGTTLAMEGCEIDLGDTGAFWMNPHCNFSSALFTVFNAGWAEDGPNNPFDFLRLQAGTLIRGGGLFGFPSVFFEQSRVFGFFVHKNAIGPTGVQYDDVVSPELVNPIYSNCPVFIRGGGLIETTPLFGFFGRGLVDQSPAAGITNDGGRVNLDAIDIEASATDAIVTKGGGVTKVRDVGGTTNAGYGAGIVEAGLVIFDPAFAGTLVKGATGEVLVGTVPTTWAAAAPAGVTDGATLNRVTPNGV